MEEEAELAGPLATRLKRRLTMIRGIADGLLVSGELADDSHVLVEVKKIIRLSTYYVENYQRRVGGLATQ
jgi:hypothetical protein